MGNSTMDTLKGLLGENADEKIKSVLSSLSQDTNSGDFGTPNQDQPIIRNTSTIDTTSIESIAQIKNIVENLTNSSNDSRSSLLLSLKPYMRSSRQSSIDTAIKILNISKLSGLFKLWGEKSVSKIL